MEKILAKKSTTDVLSECRGVLYGDDPANAANADMYVMLKSMFYILAKVEDRLNIIEKNTGTLEEVNNKLTMLTSRVQKTESELKKVNEKVNNMENDLHGIDNLCDELKTDTLEVKTEVLKMKQIVGEELNSDTNLKEEIQNMKEKMLDAQCRSMSYNLIFTGIDEREYEDGETVLKEFLSAKLSIADEIPFANIHRMGNTAEAKRRGRPRPLIAKFVHKKHLLKVKRATVLLKGTHYGVNEQYPPEIERERKKLYPIAKAERKKGSRVVLVRDKLFVNNSMIIPETYVFTTEEARPPTPPPRPHKRQRLSSTPNRSTTRSDGASD